MIQAEQATDAPPIAPSIITRRLAAIAFADVAGFSRLMALRDVETVLRWKTLRNEIMEPHMARHGGRIAEIAGDAVLIEFPSVVEAVACAVAPQIPATQARNRRARLISSAANWSSGR